jgi:hypothetical protein
MLASDDQALVKIVQDEYNLYIARTILLEVNFDPANLENLFITRRKCVIWMVLNIQILYILNRCY